MDKKKTSLLVIALSYTAAFIGAGFISGQELAQFFIRFGFKGLIGWFFIILSITIGGSFVMRKLAVYGFDSFHQFAISTFGKRLSPFVDLVINGYLWGGLIIMLSGAGNLVAEVGKLPFILGIVLVTLAVLIIILGKSRRLIATNKVLVPILIIFILVISVKILSLSNLNFVLKNSYDIKNPSPFLTNWALSVLLYLGYNTIGAIVALINVSKNTLPVSGKIGGIVGGLIISLLGSLLLFLLFINYPRWVSTELPIVYIVRDRYSFLYPIFVPCMIVAMFNVSIAYAMGISNFLVDKFNFNYKLACLCVVLTSAPLALFGFSKLLGMIYPFFGILSVILILYIGIRFLVGKILGW